MELLMRLSDEIRKARLEHGWSQSELAEKAGVSRPTVARVELGEDVDNSSGTFSGSYRSVYLTFTERE